MPVSMAKPLVGDGLWERVGVGRWGRSLAGGEKTGPSPVEQRRPGSKRHLICDGQGIPLAVILTAGNRSNPQSSPATPPLELAPPDRPGPLGAPDPVGPRLPLHLVPSSNPPPFSPSPIADTAAAQPPLVGPSRRVMIVFAPTIPPASPKGFHERLANFLAESNCPVPRPRNYAGHAFDPGHNSPATGPLQAHLPEGFDPALPGRAVRRSAARSRRSRRFRRSRRSSHPRCSRPQQARHPPGFGLCPTAAGRRPTSRGDECGGGGTLPAEGLDH
jgi:hypothetical protein